MTKPQQCALMNLALSQINEAINTLGKIQSLNPGQPIVWTDAWFAANNIQTELLRSFATLTREYKQQMKTGGPVNGERRDSTP